MYQSLSHNVNVMAWFMLHYVCLHKEELQKPSNKTLKGKLHLSDVCKTA